MKAHAIIDHNIQLTTT